MSDRCSCVKLRIPLSRSGIIIDALAGLALESIGLTPIHNTTSDASVEKLQHALALLQEMDAMPDDAHGICRQERETFWRHSNWTYRLFLLGMEDVYDGIAVQLETSFRQHRASRRQLITCLALGMFHREQQRYPGQLGNLVPKYLDSVPLDPYTTTDSSEALSLRYTLQENGQGFELYSIGPNRIDDGGSLNEAGYWNEETGDINFREWVRISNEEYLANILYESEKNDGSSPKRCF